MEKRTAFTFPGQGSYLPGVLADVASEATRELLASLDSIARESGREPVGKLLADRDSPSLDRLLADDPDQAQVAIYAASVAMAALLDERYGVRPDLVVGHSFGEIAAFVSAGILTPQDGMRLICARANACAWAAEGGMLALELNARRTQGLIDAVDDHRLALAARNAPHQTVASGPQDALRVLEQAAGTLGVRATWLRAPHPFHGPLMREPARRLPEMAGTVVTGQPVIPCWSDVLGRYLTGADDIRGLIVRHLFEPVGFVSAVRALHADEATVFIECGARDVLTRLVTACLPPVTALAPFGKRVSATDLDLLMAPFADSARQAGPLPAPVPVPKPAAPATDVAAPDDARDTDPFPELAAGKPGPEPAGPARQGAVRLPSRTELVENLRRMYADAVEYPLEVVTPDAELEADLGIDSLKQNEILASALGRYDLSDRVAELKATQYLTIEQVAGFLESLGQ